MRKNLIISSTVGLILALLMMYVAWEHNPQCAIVDNGIIDFKHWIEIGLSWFIVAFMIVFVVILFIKKLNQQPKKEQFTHHQKSQ